MKDHIPLFQTELSDCAYLNDLKSCNHIIDPKLILTPDIYDLLLTQGFRRSGEIVYRPACPECDGCMSARILIKDFCQSKSQKRVWNRVKNHLNFQVLPAQFKQDHFDLYQTYTQTRHSDGGMANTNKTEYMNFLSSHWSKTLFIEIRHHETLLAVAVTDQQPTSLSALYTFFDPNHSALSPGVISILSQIEIAKKKQLKWLYLGYWIEKSPKMSYKTHYKPIQIFKNGHWTLYNP